MDIRIRPFNFQRLAFLRIWYGRIFYMLVQERESYFFLWSILTWNILGCVTWLGSSLNPVFLVWLLKGEGAFCEIRCPTWCAFCHGTILLKDNISVANEMTRFLRWKSIQGVVGKDGVIMQRMLNHGFEC